MSMPLILVYGCEPRLLETRCWVLEQAGYAVVRAKSMAEVEAHAAAEPLEVAVLCHTLSAEESRAALEALRRLRPGIRRLMLVGNATTLTEGQQEAVMSAYEGPRRLLDEVSRLVRSAQE